MQHEGSPQFIHAHSGCVKGVAFSPKERYVFCSGATDGKVNVYSALQGHTMSTKITSPNTMKNINAVKFNADGSRILATTAKRLSVIDAERGELVGTYEDCAYSGRDRAPLASDPHNPYMAICGCTNGKGLITFDLRQPQPAHFALNVHSSTIRDIIFLDRSWPYGDHHQGSIASLSSDGICKIRTIDDRNVDTIDVKHRSNCITATPTVYTMNAQEGFESLIMVGGDSLTEYSPRPPMSGMKSRLTNHGPADRPIYKLKYTSNGHLLYAITSGGLIRRYRRVGKEHKLLGTVYEHNDEVIDMDISQNDEYIITAARDGTVGLLCLGAPSYGWTGFMEIA